jgi:succinylglutamate desuccinylase
MIKNVEVIRGKKKGPLVAIFARVHGDEPAGEYAHKALKKYFRKNPLHCGEIFLVNANYSAAKKNVRGLKYDMNRFFFDSKKNFPKGFDFNSFEYKRAMELKSLIKKMDVVLDLHSTSKASVPFSICFYPNKKSRDIISKLPVKYDVQNFSRFLKGTTLNCLPRGKIGIVVECGRHNNKSTRNVAVSSAEILLQELDMVNFKRKNAKRSPIQLRTLERQIVKDFKTINYSKNYKSFMEIKPSELIAKDFSKEYRALNKKKLVILFPGTIKSIRKGTNRDAYYLCEKI